MNNSNSIDANGQKNKSQISELFTIEYFPVERNLWIKYQSKHASPPRNLPSGWTTTPTQPWQAPPPSTMPWNQSRSSGAPGYNQ